ncbi:MAG TPA: 4-hydroxy-tetrahydrodipicolinate reductase [Opitutaceae bacterium]|jgi:4-hydroxy-tetrahydrodipicolinate reductase
MPLKIILNGARGRMGQAVAAATPALDAVIAAAVDQGDDLAAAVKLGDVVVDFSSAAATREVIAAAAGARKPLVIGTTGHSAQEKQDLLLLAAKVPCVWAGNFSVGVNLLFALTRRAVRALGDDYDAEVLEMHHRKKVDAPSGTAARLLEIILEERNLGRSALRHGRQGITGARKDGEVGIHSLRGGDVIGDHTVMFAGAGERLELTHRASDRAVFAHGAVRAARWIVDRTPGVYDMQDVLGLA